MDGGRRWSASAGRVGLPDPPGLDDPVHGSVSDPGRLRLESERLHVRRRSRVRTAVALGLVLALSTVFSALFLPAAGHPGSRAGARSEEQVVYFFATLLAYGAAYGCMQRWATSREASTSRFVGAVIGTGTIATCACWAMLATLAGNEGAWQPNSWWRVSPGRRAPAVGPEAVAALRPALLVLLLLVLPVVLAVWGAALTRRERGRLEDIEDELAVGSAAVVSAAGGRATSAVTDGPATAPALATGQPHAAPTSTWGRLGRVPPEARTARPGSSQRVALAVERRQRRLARIRFRACYWSVVTVILGVAVTALPYRHSRLQPVLSTTVYLLATVLTAVAAFVILHVWARTRTAPLRGLVGALLAAGALSAAGWWITRAQLAAVSLIPAGLDYLKDPEIMATFESRLLRPSLVQHLSWQQSVLVALAFLVPVALATWDAWSDRRDWEHLRRLDHEEPARTAPGGARTWVVPPADPAWRADPWEDGR